MSSTHVEINLSYLESIADGDQGIINELITIFLDQVPEFTEGLKLYFNTQDWKKLAALAHKAKSSVLSMGMNDLGNIDLKNLELIAKTFRLKELEKSDKLEPKEEEECAMLHRSLRNYSDEKRNWLSENSTKESMKLIIEKFINACNVACVELKTVLEN
jgi:HPt (histidine-containing phosphotransfer) domain-containing protein